MESVTVKLNIDLNHLNGFLGNTPNVTTIKAVEELIESLFTENLRYCDKCDGSYIEDEYPFIGTFEVTQ